MRKLIFLCALALCVCACKTQVVTVPQIRTEYVHDTVTEHLTDSILQTRYVYMKADTVHDVQIVERIKWRDKVQVQRVETHDSIPYPVEVIKRVRVRNGYDYFTAYGFWILLAIVALAIVIRIYLRR
jgi:hypothetical protein